MNDDVTVVEDFTDVMTTSSRLVADLRGIGRRDKSYCTFHVVVV